MSFVSFIEGKVFPSTNLEISGKDVIDDVEMKKGCIDLVNEFYKEGLDLKFADSGLETRCEIATKFYNEVKLHM